MKAALITDYCESYEEYDDVITIEDDVPLPTRKSGELLLKVLACGLAPGDYRVLSGWTSLIQKPRKVYPGQQFPYIPGGDVVGIVEETDESGLFKEGDCVISRFSGVGPSGGIAEFCTVKSAVSHVKPEFLDTHEAAVISNSPMAAYKNVQEWLREGDRVLVLGASGGVGSHVIQILKHFGASYVAAEACDEMLVDIPQVDRRIDYNQENWWEIEEFKEDRFDLVFDFSCVDGTWDQVKKCQSVKSSKEGGRYITLNAPGYRYKLKNVFHVAKMFAVGLSTFLVNVNTSKPYYSWSMVGLPDPIKEDDWNTLFELVESGVLQIRLDERGPFPFDREGVVNALQLQASRHAHGKVVIDIEHFVTLNN